MTLLMLFTLLTLLSSSLLMFSSSLPFQALSLFLMSLFIASFVGSTISPLMGVYMILIYSSGLLVLLAYFVALSPNQTLNAPKLSSFMIIILSILFMMSVSSFLLSYSHFYSPTSYSSSIITILTPSSMSLLSMIGLMLILTMVAVVKILSTSSKPMRPWK